MYPSAGTFVLIRPAQTFYERIKVLSRSDAVASPDHVPREAWRWQSQSMVSTGPRLASLIVGQAPSSSVVSRGFPSASFHTVVVEHLRTERSAGTGTSVRSPLPANQFSSSIAVTVNVSVDSVAFSCISPVGMPPSIWTGQAMVQLSSTGTSRGAAGIQGICPRMPLTTLSPRRG